MVGSIQATANKSTIVYNPDLSLSHESPIIHN